MKVSKYLEFFRKNYFKSVWKFLSKYKKLTILVILFSFLNPVFESFGIGTLFLVINAFFNYNGTTTAQVFPAGFMPLPDFFLSFDKEVFISFSSVFVLVLIILKSFFMYCTSILSSKIANYITRDLQISLFDNLLVADLKFSNSKKISDILTAIVHYAQNSSRFIYFFLLSSIVFMRIGVFLLLLFFLSWKFSVILAFIFCLIIYPLKFIFAKIKLVSEFYSKSVRSQSFRLSEILSSLILIKISCTESYEQRRFKETADNLRHSSCQEAKYDTLVARLVEVIIAILVVLIFLSNVLIFKLDFKSRLPLILFYAYFSYRIYSQIDLFLGYIGRMFTYNAPFRFYDDLEKEVILSRSKCGSIKLTNFEKGITFRGVGFFYHKKKILHDLNLFIPKGKFLAFVGEIGSGKTTIANLISGLYSVDEGEIFIDDVSMNDIDTCWWRKKIGFVPQNTIILNDTIKNNIAYGNFELNENEIIEAAKLVNIHEFILSLPNGYETYSGEKGSRFSGGQKQLIAIARAVAKKPDILIFDEATSSLDNITEKLIQDAIHRVSKNCTVIVIAHRFSTIFKADTIFVIDKGRVVEEGTNKELLRKEGVYKKLYDFQFK